MILFTTFEFIRKPWEGKELEIEKAIIQQANNFFDSISVYQDIDKEGNEGFNANVTSNNPLSQISRVNKDKKYILQHAYENPLDALFIENEDQDEFQGVDEITVGVLSPKSKVGGAHNP